MWLAKPLPFPGHRLQSQQVPEDHGIRPGMGDDDYPLVGIIDRPEVAALFAHRGDSVIGQCLLEPAHNAGVKVPERLSSGQPIPHVIHRSEIRVLQGFVDLVGRGTIPARRVVYLLEPVIGLGPMIGSGENRVGRLNGPPHRRDPQLIDAVE